MFQDRIRDMTVGLGQMSKCIRRDDLAAGAGGDRPPDAEIDRVLDEGDVAVAEEQVHAAGVKAPRGLPAGVVIDDAVGPVGVGRAGSGYRGRSGSCRPTSSTPC